MLKISPDSFKVYVKGLILQLFISNSLRGKHFSLILYFTRHQQCRWYLKSPKMSIWIFLCISQVEFFCFFSPLSLWNQDMHWWAPPQASPVFLTQARSFGASRFHKTRKEKKAYGFPLLWLIKKVLALRFFIQSLLLYVKITKFKGLS